MNLFSIAFTVNHKYNLKKLIKVCTILNKFIGSVNSLAVILKSEDILFSFDTLNEEAISTEINTLVCVNIEKPQQ